MNINKAQLLASCDYLSYVAEVLMQTTVPNRIWKARAFEKASASLRCEAGRLTSDEDTVTLEFIGDVGGVGHATITAIREFIDDGGKSYDTRKVRSIAAHLDNSRILWTDAHEMVERIKAMFKDICSATKTVLACGSYRRNAVTCGDLDFVTSLHPHEVNRTMEHLGAIKLYGGDTRMRFELDGIGIDVRLCHPHFFGSFTLHCTGPAQFNVQMRKKAKEMGYKLNEYGVYDSEGNQIKETERMTDHQLIEFFGMKDRRGATNERRHQRLASI